MPDTAFNNTVTHNALLQSIRQLQLQAEAQFNQLRQQAASMGIFKSNVNRLISRYHANESYLSQAATWYSTWWRKLCIDVCVLSLGASVCSTGIMGILLVAVAAPLYGAISFLLSNHASVTAQQDKQLREDIQILEKTLTISVARLNGIEAELTRVLTLLCEKNVQFADELVVLKEQTDELQHQVREGDELSHQLEQTNSALRHTIETLNIEQTQFIQHVAELQRTMSISAASLHHVGETIEGTIRALSADERRLAGVCEQLHHSTQALQLFEHTVQSILATLSTRKASSPINTVQSIPRNISQNPSIEPTPGVIFTPTPALVMSDALTALKAHELLQATAQLKAEEQDILSSKTNALLAHANQYLDALKVTPLIRRATGLY